MQYNKENGITPETIKKQIYTGLQDKLKARQVAQQAVNLGDDEYDAAEIAVQIEKEMLEAAEKLDFEKAAFLRDQLKELKELPQIGKRK
jgi:excinuclease ABC subunit B